MDEEEKNSDERFERAFQGCRGVMWYVFDEADEVVGRVNEILTTHFLPERVVEL